MQAQFLFSFCGGVVGLGDWGSLEGFETNYITKKQSARIWLDAATGKNAG